MRVSDGLFSAPDDLSGLAAECVSLFDRTLQEQHSRFLRHLLQKGRGRTVPIWNRFNQTEVFQKGVPWLLRFFDRLSWYEVSPEELLEERRQMLTGEYVPKIKEETFRLGDYLAFLDREADSINAFKTQQKQAFAEERQRWENATDSVGTTHTRSVTSYFEVC